MLFENLEAFKADGLTQKLLKKLDKLLIFLNLNCSFP